jgi:hypothetical protein
VLYHYGQGENGQEASKTYWKKYTSEVNPFVAKGFLGSCQFPQITSGGLQDSWQHGRDLWDVYGNFIGHKSNSEFRVTRNVITSEVAGMVVKGMFRDDSSFPLLVQVMSTHPTMVDNIPTLTVSRQARSIRWSLHISVRRLTSLSRKFDPAMFGDLI